MDKMYYSFSTYVGKTQILFSSESLEYMHSQNYIEPVLNEDEKVLRWKRKRKMDSEMISL